MGKFGQFHQGLEIPSQDDDFTLDHLQARLAIATHNREIVKANIKMMKELQRKYPKLDYKDEIISEERRVKGLDAHIKYLVKQIDEEKNKP